jgi:hypothetical protein
LDVSAHFSAEVLQDSEDLVETAGERGRAATYTPVDRPDLPLQASGSLGEVHVATELRARAARMFRYRPAQRLHLVGLVEAAGAVVVRRRA